MTDGPCFSVCRPLPSDDCCNKVQFISSKFSVNSEFPVIWLRLHHACIICEISYEVYTCSTIAHNTECARFTLYYVPAEIDVTRATCITCEQGVVKLIQNSLVRGIVCTHCPVLSKGAGVLGSMVKQHSPIYFANYVIHEYCFLATGHISALL